METAAKKSIRKIQILLIEDNPGDVRLTEEVLKQSGAGCSLTALRDPEEALELLRGEGQHVGKVVPEMIFLDLNMPKVSGLDVIQRIRETDDLGHIPIIVLSSSENPDEIRKAYRCGANCFVRKPAELDQFINFMTTTYEFWCGVVVLPQTRRANYRE